MIKFTMKSDLFNNVKTPLFILIFVVVSIIAITIYFVSKEVKE